MLLMSLIISCSFLILLNAMNSTSTDSDKPRGTMERDKTRISNSCLIEFSVQRLPMERFLRRRRRISLQLFLMVTIALVCDRDFPVFTVFDFCVSLQSGVILHCLTVFAYGATGAGKTHTMIGTQENPGL